MGIFTARVWNVKHTAASDCPAKCVEPAQEQCTVSDIQTTASPGHGERRIGTFDWLDCRLLSETTATSFDDSRTATVLFALEMLVVVVATESAPEIPFRQADEVRPRLG